MTSKTPKEWGDIYITKQGQYDRFRVQLEHLLGRLINETGIEISQISSRTKDIDSFIEKVIRKGYEVPFEECTDLVGIRIITYYLEDVSKIARIIEDEFNIDFENSVDKSKTLEPDRFGYLSVHYVVSLSPSRATETEWRSYANIKAEIQLRTVLQHAWATIDQKLRYKIEDEVPKDLRRQLFRLVALLELADEEFEDVLKHTEEIKKIYEGEVKNIAIEDRYLEDVGDKIPTTELNLLSLNAYLNLTKQDIKWMDISNRILKELIEKCAPPSVHVEAMVDRMFSGTGSDLLALLKIVGVESIKELDDILRSASDFGKTVIEEVYSTWLEFELKRMEGPGSMGFSFTSYQNMAILILYAKKNILKDLLKENPNLLKKLPLFYYVKLGIIKYIKN